MPKNVLGRQRFEAKQCRNASSFHSSTHCPTRRPGQGPWEGAATPNHAPDLGEVVGPLPRQHVVRAVFLVVVRAAPREGRALELHPAGT